MLLLIFLILILSMQSLSSSKETDTGHCLWYNNECVSKCPDGLVEFRGDCKNTYWSAQKTCLRPQHQFVGYTCGDSRCDCPDPTVLDEATGVCYDLDNCPTRHELNS